MADTDLRTELQQHIEFHRYEAEHAAKLAGNERPERATQLGWYGTIHAILALTRAVQALGPNLPTSHDQVPTTVEEDEREAADEAYQRHQCTVARMLFNTRQPASISGEFPSGHSYSYPYVRIVAVDDDGFEVEPGRKGETILRLEWSGLRHCQRAAHV